MQKSRILNLCRNLTTLRRQNPEGQSRLSHYFDGAIWRQEHKISKVLTELFLWAPKPVSCVLRRQPWNHCHKHLLKCKRTSYT